MVYKFGTYELDTGRFELRAGGTPLSIEPQAFSLLELLVSNRGKMISKDAILEEVTARNTTFGYKNTTLGAKPLGSELGVGYLVEGSVRRSGDRIRVTAELIDAETGLQLWTDRYDRQFRDVFAVQDEITAMLGARLEPEIGLAERMKLYIAGLTKAGIPER